MSRAVPVPELSQPDDLTLIRSYVEGDASAFDRIFARYHQRIRALCSKHVGDGQVAEDLVQETFYNVLRSLRRVDDTFNFSAWIHRIATNLCHDELRRRHKAQHHLEPGGVDVEDAVLRLVDRDRRSHPETALEMAELRSLVWEVAKQLPERHRMILTLRELQGLSYSSIAHVMGISESAVETLLHRARRRFKEQFLMRDAAQPENTCTALRQLVETVGSSTLRRDQRRVLAAHLRECAGCEELLGPLPEPAVRV